MFSIFIRCICKENKQDSLQVYKCSSFDEVATWPFSAKFVVTFILSAI